MLPKDLNTEQLYRLAMTFIDGIGPKTARSLTEHFGNATDAFAAPFKLLKNIGGVGEVRARAFKNADILHKAEAEMNYALKHDIRLYYLQNEDYPQKLKQCADAPMVLFYKGTAAIETNHMVAIVGTRKNTDYGSQLTEDLVKGLKGQNDLTIVSGLAHGIDAVAHRSAVAEGIPTIGVLAHGLDKMYPSSHRSLAKEMQINGGILTEFPSGTAPDRTNFPVRNRVVAGLCDVTVVVESDDRGGAMITAFMAASYNREVAAFPGRISDSKSAGPLKLVRMNIASMIRNADDLLEVMGWKKVNKENVVQKQLLLALTVDEQTLVDAMQGKDSVHTDELLLGTGLAASKLSATLLQLEMQGVVRAMPGKQYRLS